MVRTLRYTKWGGSEHWSCPVVELGRDDHGLWLGLPAGTRWRRPGVEVTWDWPAVILIPPAPYVARFLDIPPTPDRPDPAAVYVDVTTLPNVSDSEVRAVDLDLDVIRLRSGAVILDDEDEFDDNRTSLGYPNDLVATARASAQELTTMLIQKVEPFGIAASAWLAKV